MDFYASNYVLHIKRLVYSSVGLGYQYACDYPMVPCAGILLLFLHKLCPSLFMFLLSSSPVFLLTALLLGALLTYGEPCAGVIGEETLGNQQQTLPRKAKTSVTDCSTEEVEDVADVACAAEKSSENQVGRTEERTFGSIVHDTHPSEEKVTPISTDKVLSSEEVSVFSDSNGIVEAKEQLQQQQRLLIPSNVIVESEEQTKEGGENVELQGFDIRNSESYHNEMHNRYQLGELMSSCWQPVMRQDPCSDSESDSSSDASMTDIIPLLDELNHPINLGADHPSSTFRDNPNSSSDDEDDPEEDGDLCSDQDEAKEKKDDEYISEHSNNVGSSDLEKVGNVDSLMEQQRKKNILKFELDKWLMDMQAAEAAQKMEEALSFRVQVPSIFTPRTISNGCEETTELPQIPDSAPSVLLPCKKPFDVPFDQIVDPERKLQETWTPRSYFPSTQHRKQGNLYLRQSTCLQHHNDAIAENPELSRKDACNSRSASDSEETGNRGRLFGSLEAPTGEEIELISAAVSDACVLEENREFDKGGEHSALCSSSSGNNSEQHILETDSISEINLLFKCRMDEVLVQSISESAIGQPLMVKHEDESSGTLSADFGMPAIEAGSVEELDLRIAQLTKETLTYAASDHTYNNGLVQDRLSGALHAENGHSLQFPIENGHNSNSTLDEAIAMNEV